MPQDDKQGATLGLRKPGGRLNVFTYASRDEFLGDPRRRFGRVNYLNVFDIQLNQASKAWFLTAGNGAVNKRYFCGRGITDGRFGSGAGKKRGMGNGQN
jgi:hypothetical protein